MQDLYQGNTYNQFPDLLADPKKIDDNYILQYGRAMWYTFNRLGYSIFYNARTEYRDHMRYAMGGQSINQYKKWLGWDENGNEGGGEEANLDWRVLNLASKYINIVQDKLAKELFQITCTPIDALAVDQKRDYVARVQAMKEMQAWLEQKNIMVTRDFAGIDPPPNIDGGTDEFEIFASMSLKHRWAMSMEIMIESILNQNEFDHIRREIAWDLPVFGTSVIKITERPDSVPYIEKVRPENFIVSNAKDDRFSNMVYAGEVKTMTVNEFFQRAGDKFSEQQRKDIVERYSKMNRPTVDYNYIFNSPYANFYQNTPMIEVLDFVFEAPAGITYEKKKDKYGNNRMDRKAPGYPSYGDKEYKSRYGNERELLKTEYPTLYKGLWILNSEYICDCGLMQNVIRDKQTFQPFFPYVAIAPNMKNGIVTSMVKQMIPVLNAIQLNWLKHNDAIAKAIPKGAALDLDAIENVAIGKAGQTLKPRDIVDLYYKRGTFVYRSKDQAGKGMNGIPISELENGLSADAVQYFNNIISYINMLRDITGLNELADGSTPDPKLLKSVAEVAMQGANSALGPYYFGSQSIFERTCKMISISVPAAFKRGAIAPMETAIGSPTVRFFGENSDIDSHTWAIKVEAKPSKDDWNSLYEDARMALQTEQITIADMTFLRDIDNLKQARQYLVLAVKKKQEADMQEQQALSETNAQVQMQSNQMAEQMKQQTLQMQHQFNMEMESKKQETILLQEEEKRKTILAQASLQNEGKMQTAEIQASAGEAQAHIKANAQVEASKNKAEKPTNAKKP